MSSFKERKAAQENKFARDEEFRFKVTARRNRLFGEWAAGLLKKEGDAADAYIKEVIASDFEEAGDEDVLRKVMEDLKAGGVVEFDKDIRIKLDECFVEAAEALS